MRAKTPPPITNPKDGVDYFVVFFIRECPSLNSPWKWECCWKNYRHMWSALRYGTPLTNNHFTKNLKYYVKNITTGEICWRSWEDENPY